MTVNSSVSPASTLYSPVAPNISAVAPPFHSLVISILEAPTEAVFSMVQTISTGA